MIRRSSAPSTLEARASAPHVLQVPAWTRIAGLSHGFFGRAGGVSTGARASLNLSYAVGDDQPAVDENWRRVRTLVSAISIVTMRQVHGADVVIVRERVGRVDAVDGLVTDRAGIALGVMTADCVPILMIAPQSKVAAAVHAGWRGTLAGVAGVAVESLRDQLGVSAASLFVAMGPAIGQCCYEVDARIGHDLERRWGPLGDAWQARGQKGQLDLRAVNRLILARAGVSLDSIVEVGPCTACDMADYFSHRASGGKAGRQLSFVGWET